MTSRHQRGHLYKAHGAWHVRFRENVLESGATVRKQVSRRIAAIAEYPRRADVMPLVEEILSPINTGTATVDSTQSLNAFWDSSYFPHVEATYKPATIYGYARRFRLYISPYIGEIRLRDFRTVDGQRFLVSLREKRNLGRRSLAQVKAGASAIFRYAKQIGVLNSANPMRETSLPRTPKPEPTYAYSLEEIQHMLSVLPEPARTLCAVAAFTGLRKGEIRGLRWEDYDAHRHSLRIRRTVWHTHITETKTEGSEGKVPVIPVLGMILDGQTRTSGWMFPSSSGFPLKLGQLADRIIEPRLALKWHGWHAFRRGLATNLHNLGVQDIEIQAILRHSDIHTTQQSYIKAVPTSVSAAMQRVEEAYEAKKESIQ